MRTFIVTGLARFGGVDSLVAPRSPPSHPDRPPRARARRLRRDRGPSAPGVSDPSWRQDRPLLPSGVDVSTSAEQSAGDAAGISQAITFIRGFLLLFGAIALFVAAFVIFIAVDDGGPALARAGDAANAGRLTAPGAALVIAEATIIGLAASVAGLAAGYGLAKGLTAFFAAMELGAPGRHRLRVEHGHHLPAGGHEWSPVLAGIVPAIRATRVAPISAVPEGGKTCTRGRFARFTPVVALTTIAVAGALLVRGLMVNGIGTSERLLTLGIGTLALFVGVAMVSSSLVRPIAAVIGWPIARLRGVSGGLARENAVRNPSRTAATAAALMIGLALVTFVSVLGAGLVGTARTDIREQITADYVVTSSSGWETISPAVAPDHRRRLPGSVVSGVRQDRGRVGGSAQDVSGIDPTTIAAVYDFAWSEGSRSALATLNSDGAIVRPQLRRRSRPRHRRPPRDHQPVRGHPGADGDRDRRAAPAQPAPRLGDGVAARLRQRLRARQGPVHVRRDRWVRRHHRRLASGVAGRLPRHGGRHGVPVRAWLATDGPLDDPQPALRAAGTVGGREPLRDGQHAGPGRPRADPRAGDAARGRHDAAPDSQHDPGREHHHVPDRRGSGHPARHRDRRARPSAR